MSTTVLLEHIKPSPGSSVTIGNVTWQQYEDLANYLDQESINYRISYFDHTIELMSPDYKHENPRERLYGLILIFCFEKEIDYYSYGSTDVKKPEIAGKQPDTSFCFGTRKDKPDLAVEVINTSGTVKKLHTIYLELEIQELWIWKNKKVNFYKLESGVYQPIEESIVLSELTADLLNKCLSISNEREAIREFRKQISQ